MDNDKFVKVTPVDKAEFIIRKHYVFELNGPYKDTPAKVFTLTEKGERCVTEVDEKEYKRLVKILLDE